MLTFVPTPIGNLGDLSFRSLEILKEAELILCEDTRVTKKLLNLISQKLNIIIDTANKDFLSIHSHNEKAFLTDTNKELILSKNTVYMSDAGMPCISDPGALLVNFCIEHDIKYDVLPGANALLTAYAMSGFEKKEFTFFGFLPHKGKDRQNQLQSICESQFITILYESPHRLLKLLEQLENIDENRTIFVVKELTKIYQQSFKGTVKEVYSKLKETDIRGEWVIVIDTIVSQVGDHITLKDIQELDLPPKQKAKLISKLTGQNTKDIYNNLI
jgi:16S rRNA (cytidine1402-2'-O)-methyltransferase